MQQVFDLRQPENTVAFTDVPGGQWISGAAQASASYMGSPAGTRGQRLFYPSFPLDRQEAALVIVRLLEAKGVLRALTSSDGDKVLSGVKDNAGLVTSLRASVATVVGLNILSTLPDGNFRPTESLKRSQLNKAAAALIKLLGNASKITNAMPPKRT